MPRINHTEYYRRYQFLRTAWCNFETIYGYLDTRKQADLHKFYQPSRQLSQPELVAHIESVRVTNPSLAQRAGTYVGVLERLFLEASKQQGISSIQANKMIQATYVAMTKNPGSVETRNSSLPA